MADESILLKGLFLNTTKASCSIHESGKMCYDCLKLSSQYSLDYQEISDKARTVSLNYDFYIFNYHHITMGWLDTSCIRQLPGFKFTTVLEVMPNNPFVLCPKGDFDAYLALDPTITLPDQNVYSFPRPLEMAASTDTNVDLVEEVPIIGSFGFATTGKGFDRVIEAVNKEFDRAIIKINIPRGDNVVDELFQDMNSKLKSIPSKNGIEVRITNDFFDKEELINWCAQNTLNVFLYDRNQPGLSATTDQAIASGRPLAVSSDYTFRHIHQYLPPYPFQSLKQSIENSPPQIKQIQKDWAPWNFTLKFEQVLKDQHVKVIPKQDETLTLQKKANPNALLNRIKADDLVPPIYGKVVRNIERKVRRKKIASTPSIKTLEPFVHYAVLTFSQYNEDLFIDLLLGRKEKGFYVDIGANDPSYNSNTKRFYLRGWSGINIEPDAQAFSRISQSRPRDININVAISGEEGDLTFYKLLDDTTLSTLDHATALKMSKILNLPISTTTVKTVPLAKLLDENTNGSLIDFMSVDAEGVDLVVLESNDWIKYRPSVIMVESNNDFEKIRSFMTKKDYLHIYNNNFNAIFIDKLTKDINLLDNLNWQQV